MSLLLAALPNLVDLSKAPKVSVKATLSNEVVAAGEALSGKIWINPGSSRSKTAAVINSIFLRASCRVKVEWQDGEELKRKGEAFIYQLEKQLLVDDLEVAGPKVLDFKLTLPHAAQRTSTSWNPSNRFAYTAGHELPPSIRDVVEHVLEIEVKAEGGLFRSPKQVIVIPYRFVQSRSAPAPDPIMQVESKIVRYKAAGTSRNGRIRPQNDERHSTTREPSNTRGKVEYDVNVRLPNRVFIGGELPIEMTIKPRSQAASEAAGPEAILRDITVNIISYTIFRVKLAENTGGLDPEAGKEFSIRHRLFSAKELLHPIRDSTRIDKVVGGLRALAPAAVPNFKTYNAARTYKMELWLRIHLNGKSFDVAFSKAISIESAHYRPPPPPPPPTRAPQSLNSDQAQTETANDEGEEDEDTYLPPYSGPPPAYNDSVDNRMSLTTQAMIEGVDIIDLI